MESYASNVQDHQTSGLQAVVPSEERTMFVTFSRGHPVCRGEVINFLTKRYGQCIESFKMHKAVVAYGHPLSARIVFYSPSTIDEILNGEAKVKFTINRKHVWMKKSVTNKIWQRVHPSRGQAVASTISMPKTATSTTSPDDDQELGRSSTAANCLVVITSLAAVWFRALFSCFKPAAN